MPLAEKRANGNARRNNYELPDDLSSVAGTVFYYRLKMLDIDGKFTYSSIVIIKKDEKTINGIVINPNTIISGATTVRFTSTRSTTVEFKVIDISGKILMQQINKASEGNNSIVVTNLDKLQPGIYLLQLNNNGEASVIKFSVAR